MDGWNGRRFDPASFWVKLPVFRRRSVFQLPRSFSNRGFSIKTPKKYCWWFRNLAITTTVWMFLKPWKQWDQRPRKISNPFFADETRGLLAPFDTSAPRWKKLWSPRWKKRRISLVTREDTGGSPEKVFSRCYGKLLWLFPNTIKMGTVGDSWVLEIF